MPQEFDIIVKKNPIKHSKLEKKIKSSQNYGMNHPGNEQGCHNTKGNTVSTLRKSSFRLIKNVAIDKKSRF